MIQNKLKTIIWKNKYLENIFLFNLFSPPYVAIYFVNSGAHKFVN